MKKLLWILMIISNPLFSGDIEVSIQCEDTGTLILFLVDKDNFNKPMDGLIRKEVKVNKKGEYVCLFININEGRYGVKAFLDTNMDNKLNIGIFGPSEPWGFSWRDQRKKTKPRFQDIFFEHKEKNSLIKVRLES